MKILSAALLLILMSNNLNAGTINDIVNLAREEKLTFCQQSSIFTKKSIRSGKGKRCRGIGAAVAMAVCHKVPGFTSSHCADNAKKDDIKSLHVAKFVIIQALKIKVIRAHDICDVITEILPHKKKVCHKLAEDFEYLPNNLSSQPVENIPSPAYEDMPAPKDEPPAYEERPPSYEEALSQKN